MFSVQCSSIHHLYTPVLASSVFRADFSFQGMIDRTDVIIVLIIAGLTYMYFNSSVATSTVHFPVMQKKKLEIQEPTLLLFYGSQTGTAEDFALRLAKETSGNYNIKTMVCDLEDYDLESIMSLENCLLGFFMATYGEGEPTDNATDFYSAIMDGAGVGEDEGDETESLSGDKPLSLPYFVFGLGNSTYAHFNAIGKRLDKRLQRLGGDRLADIGLGDDDKR